MGAFLKYPEYLLLHWSLNAYLVLIKSSAARMQECADRCVEMVRQVYAAEEAQPEWHVALAPPTTRLSALPGCFQTASRLWAYRYLLPRQHILTEETTAFLAREGSAGSLTGLDPARMDPAILRSFLETADAAETDSFVEQYLLNIQQALASQAVCQYLLLSAFFCAGAFVQGLGADPAAFASAIPDLALVDRTVSPAELRGGLRQILLEAVRLRFFFRFLCPGGRLLCALLPGEGSVLRLGRDGQFMILRVPLGKFRGFLLHDRPESGDLLRIRGGALCQDAERHGQAQQGGNGFFHDTMFPFFGFLSPPQSGIRKEAVGRTLRLEPFPRHGALSTMKSKINQVLGGTFAQDSRNVTNRPMTVRFFSAFCQEKFLIFHVRSNFADFLTKRKRANIYQIFSINFLSAPRTIYRSGKVLKNNGGFCADCHLRPQEEDGMLKSDN